MRPIVLATDYGSSGGYVGQLKSVIYRRASHARVIDLDHCLPGMNPKASAYLLAGYLEYLPQRSVVVAVVDPGVGSSRAPVLMEGDGHTFIGPDNGLLSIMYRKLAKAELFEILLQGEPASRTFHGRDVFAPVAANIVSGSRPDLKPVSAREMQGAGWPDSLYEVIHTDRFGNAITGITFHPSDTSRVLRVNGRCLRYAEAFYCVEKGEGFWYCNSNNLVEIAARDGSAAENLGITVGTGVEFD